LGKGGDNLKFEIKKAVNGQFFFILVANNGQTLLQSETYVAKQSARAAIVSAKREVSSAIVVDTTIPNLVNPKLR
jgi:uncharacterized protein YegP (UPF0339 family)